MRNRPQPWSSASAPSTAFELEEVDVSVDPVLHARYGERIPVLELDGEELFEFFVQEASLRERLDRVSRS